MRSFLVVIFFLLFFIVSIPLYLILLLINVFNPNLKHKLSQKIVRFVCKTVLLSGVKLTVIGVDKIPVDESVLFVFNHRSYFDILVSYATVPNQSAFVAKKELKNIPFINLWMLFLNCLFLDRDDVRQSLTVILEAIELVKNGYSVFIAPEGTRNQEKGMLPFKEGSFKIAQKTGCPIVTASINNADNIFESHFPWIRKGHIILEYGDPVYPKDLAKEDQKRMANYFQKIMKQTLDKNEANLEF